MNHDTLLLIFVGLTGFALLVQAIVMLAFFLTIRKTVAAVQADVQELRTGIMPVLTKSRELMDQLGPKVDSIATDLAGLARTLREQGAEFQASTNEILGRVNRQAGRLDLMFTNVVDGVEHASNVVVNSVNGPVRQISAMIASAKAFLTVLTTGKRETRQTRISADQDMFV
jgi:uncharacterized protein YoxC